MRAGDQSRLLRLCGSRFNIASHRIRNYGWPHPEFFGRPKIVPWKRRVTPEQRRIFRKSSSFSSSTKIFDIKKTFPTCDIRMAIGEFVSDPDEVTRIEDSVGGRPLLETRTKDVVYVRDVKKSSLFFTLFLNKRCKSSSREESNHCRGSPVLMRSVEGASGSSSDGEAEEGRRGILPMDSGKSCPKCGGTGGSHKGKCMNGVPS